MTPEQVAVPYHIVVADDSDLYQSVLERFINKIYPIALVTRASNGITVLDIVAHKRVDLIVADWYMPQMNGHELVKELRGQGTDVPVVLISGTEEHAHAALMVGANGFLAKPFTLDEFTSVLTTVLPLDKHQVS